MRVTRQPEYFSKPFSELSWKQRFLLIGHLTFAIPVVLVVILAPGIGIWQIILGESAVIGVLTLLSGLLFWVILWVMAQY